MAMSDPMRSHGAWVVLFASVGAGALVGSRGSLEVGLVAGGAFAGGFLLTAAFAVRWRRKARQALVGAALAAMSAFGALALGAPREFLIPVALAGLVAPFAVLAARRLGMLASTTLVVELGVLALAAPATALAGGARPVEALVLFAALWPFFCWRSLGVARELRGVERWDRNVLRARGLREALYAALWTAASTGVLALA